MPPRLAPPAHRSGCDALDRALQYSSTGPGTIAAITGTALATITVGATSALRGWTATLDSRILLAAPLIGLVTGALAGALPAARASKTAPAITLRA